MILLEVVEAERRKVVAALSSGTGNGEGSSRRRGDSETVQATAPSSTQPPDYATSQAHAESQKEDDEDDGTLFKPAKWSERRLGRAIMYALVIYLVLSIAIAVPLFIVLRNKAEQNEFDEGSEKWMKGNGKLPPPPPPPNRLPPDVSLLPSIYGSPVQCNSWTYVSASSSGGQGSYTLKYTLPVTDTLYIRSNFSEPDDNDDISSAVTGSLRVSVQDNPKQSNATVTVTMKDIGEEALSESSVCLMASNTTWGLAIIVPNDAFEDRYYFDVNLQLPLLRSYSPLSNLVTYLPSFNQSFGNLDSYMYLDSIDVQGSLGSINFESVHARNVLVKASAAPISGTFNASDKVILETVLEPITANISIYNEGNEDRPTLLDIETGNSNIVLNVTLRSHTNGSLYCPPMFMNSLKTFSGAIDATYYHEPTLASSTLFLRATNTLEPARIFVDSTFEGIYDVHTTLADAIVDHATDIVDPSGGNRTRSYEDDLVSSSRIYGWIGWGDRPASHRRWPQGHIEVVSSLSDAVLQLTDAPDLDVQKTTSEVSRARAL